jgi:hypothetical protein
MIFADKSPEQVLRPEGLDEYRQGAEVLSEQLVYLHSNVALLEQMSRFPMRFYDAPEALLEFLAANLFEYSLVIVHRIWHDTDQDSFTLRRWRDFTAQAIKPEYSDALHKRLRQVRVAEEHDMVLEKIKSLRNRCLAHVDRQFHFEPDQRDGPVTLSDLRSVASRLGDIYNALSFGSQTHFVLVQFSTGTENGWHGGEFGHVLDLIAFSSRYITAYDEDRSFWFRHFYPDLDADDVKALNKLRRRHGKDEIQ